MNLEIAQGRLAAAEQLGRAALDDPRLDGSGLPLVLGLIYARQGRRLEAEQLIETTWNRLVRKGQASWERAIPLARLHIRLRLDPPPVEAIAAFLDQCSRRAPDDDRGWLGRANLAMQARKYDEAKRLLDACLQRRPDDVPVWRTRLDWALATNQVEAVGEAAKHLRAEDVGQARVHSLAAWLAARRGDTEAEQRALNQLVAVDPNDFIAWNRLIDLAVRNGQIDLAEALRGREGKIEKLQARYRTLDQRNQPIRDAAEMALLAEKLGHPFEARAFLIVAIAANPERVDLRAALTRLESAAGTGSSRGQTLADALAADLDPPPRRQLPQSFNSNVKLLDFSSTLAVNPLLWASW
jgi:tetratricopeptide (TPR) repeat protein